MQKPTPRIILIVGATLMAVAALAACGTDEPSEPTAEAATDSADDSILTEPPESTLTIDGETWVLTDGGIDPAPFGPESEPAIFGTDEENVGVFITVDLEKQEPTGEVLVIAGETIAEGQLDLTDLPVLAGAGDLSVLSEDSEPTGDTIAIELDYRNLLGSSTFELDGNQAIIRGELGALTTDQMRHLIDNHPEVDTLVLADIDGSVDDEANAVTGRLVRGAGLNIIVPSDGQIYSGGVDLFAAGTARTVEAGAILGVHSWCCGPDGEDAGQLDRDDSAHDEQLAYFGEMLGESGADFYYFTIDSAPFGEIHSMTADEVNAYGLSTTETVDTGVAPEEDDDDAELILGDGVQSTDDDCRIVTESPIEIGLEGDGLIVAACPVDSARIGELRTTFDAQTVAEDVEGFAILVLHPAGE